jgi:hypothetical protein
MPALLASALTTTAFALWSPPVRDLAAHTFRAGYFEQHGFAIWNGTWYGGHYLPTYSVLFPSLAALLDPVWAAAIAGVACAWSFDRLVAARWGPAALPASLWFAALGPLALLANGWLAFALGLAFALAALLALQRGRLLRAGALALACGLASPVAAFLLGLVLGAVVAAALWERRTAAPASAGSPLRSGAVAVVALAPVFVLALLFPDEGGEFPFWFSAYWPLALTCAGALLVLRSVPGERPLRWVVAAYGLAGTLLWIVPGPIGGNITRLGSLFAGPVLLAVVLARGVRAPRALVGAVLVLALAWQVVTPLPDTFQSLGDPSTERSYYAPLNDWLSAHGAARDRIEIPYTFNHWETAYVSPQFSLARGWLRQLDLARNDLFYDGRLRAGRYRAWLREKGVRFVALPDSQLDYSAEDEAALVRAGQPFLRLRARLAHWRIYELVPPARLLAGGPGARLTALSAQSFELVADRPGRWTVRVAPSPYRHLERGAGCVGRDGDWTLVRADRPGLLRARVSFSAGRAVKALVRSYPDC